MRLPWPTLVLSLILLALAPGRAAASGFDTDLESWTATGVQLDVGLGPTLTVTVTNNAPDMVWEAAGGNPGGYARFTDVIESPSSWASAPGSFLGDVTGFDLLSFDHKLFDVGLNVDSIGPYSAFFVSGNPNDFNVLVWTALPPAGPTDWVHFDIDLANLTLFENVNASSLDPSFPSITPGSIGFHGTMTPAQILGNVTALLLPFELVNNGSTQQTEHGGLDNVEYSSAPEPATLLLLLLATAAVRSRQR